MWGLRAPFPMPDQFTKQVVWMFTTNGKLSPEVSIEKGNVALLRILNASPTVTYDLRLWDSSAHADRSFAVLAVDGTLPGNVPAPIEVLRAVPVKAAQLDRLLLLPASRAEILVWSPDDTAREMHLYTAGFSTGITPDSADLWPPARLAVIRFATGSSLDTPVYVQPPRMPTKSITGSVSKERGCIRLLQPHERRRIRLFSDDNDLFFIGSWIVKANGEEDTDPAQIIPLQTMPMMDTPEAWKNTKHICIRQGDTETWEILNLTNEIHNFHIHQSKFKVDPHKGVDPTGMLKDFPLFAQGEGVKSNGADPLSIWHDTFPVPPAKSDNTKLEPGRIVVTINFSSEQQLGRFVFHCHILEHEDKGMMAPIEVLPAR
jgi:FtsP/CotA-like multicopper oxidase with cupredoxin domain